MGKSAPLLITLVVLMTATLACRPVSPLRSGDKNFERGWKSLVSRNMDKALAHFANGADAYAEALGEDPPGRQLGFPSTLAKAGMCFYYAGRYLECTETLDRLPAREENLWEPAIYRALAYGRQGDKANMLKWLDGYLDHLAGQPILSNEIKRLMPELKGGARPDTITDAIETALHRQIKNNVRVKGRSAAHGAEKCYGAYWWRYHSAPCSRSKSADD